MRSECYNDPELSNPSVLLKPYTAKGVPWFDPF